MPRPGARPDPAFYMSKVKTPSTEGQRPGPTRRSSPQRAQKGVLAPGGWRHPPMAAKLSILAAVAATVLAVAAAPAPAVPNTPPQHRLRSPRLPGHRSTLLPPSRGRPSPPRITTSSRLPPMPVSTRPCSAGGSDDFTTQNTRATVAEDDPERDVLLACARDRGRRLGLGLDGRPVVPQGTGQGRRRCSRLPAAPISPSEPTRSSSVGRRCREPRTTWCRLRATRPSARLPFILHGDPTGIPRCRRTHSQSRSRSPPGRIHWNVIPIDAEGNRGVPSPTASFTWTWPSTTTLQVNDLNAAPRSMTRNSPGRLVAGAAATRSRSTPRRTSPPARRFVAPRRPLRLRSRRRRSSRTTRTTGESAQSIRTGTPASGTSARRSRRRSTRFRS